MDQHLHKTKLKCENYEGHNEMLKIFVLKLVSCIYFFFFVAFFVAFFFRPFFLN